MTTIECGGCGRQIERGNYINGVIVCADCALEAESELPQRKNVESDWRAFSTTKRRRRAWR
jgi:hypothetical protein